MQERCDCILTTPEAWTPRRPGAVGQMGGKGAVDLVRAFGPVWCSKKGKTIHCYWPGGCTRASIFLIGTAGETRAVVGICISVWITSWLHAPVVVW